jgi:hypothetical protein
MSNAPQAHPIRSIIKWIAVLGLAVILLVIASAFSLRRSALAVPNVEPFDVDAFTSFTIADKRNAATLYREAVPRFVEQKKVLSKGGSQVEAFDKSYEATIGKDWKFANDDVRRWVEANRPAMETWKQGSQLDDCLVIRPDLVHLTTSISLSLAAGEFGRLAVLEAGRLTADGQVDAAWDWYRAVLRSSRHVARHSGWIPRFVGANLQAIATEAIVPWSGRPELTAAQLRKFLDETLAIDAMTPPASDCYKAEYLATVNIYFETEATLGRLGTLLNVLGARERGLRSLRLVFANWLGQVDRPRFERTAVCHGSPDLYERDPTAPPGSLSAEEIQDYCALSSSRPDVVVMKIIMPSSGVSAVDALDREQAKRAGLILTLALQLFYREHGELPADLSALVRAGYLKSIPADPFGKGEPFRYRRSANTAEGGLVWSVWLDGIDQEGKLCVEPYSAASDPGDKCFVIQVPPPRKAPSTGSQKRP